MLWEHDLQASVSTAFYSSPKLPQSARVFALGYFLICFSVASLSRPQRPRQQECHQTKDLMSRTMAAHTHYKSFYISLPSPVKQEHEMTMFRIV